MAENPSAPIVSHQASRLPRAAGVLIPLFSLNTAKNLGRGEIRDLIPFLDFTLAMRHRIIQLLPLGETSPDEASPYSALSVFAIDPLYISLDAIDGVASADLDQARAKVASAPAGRRTRLLQAKLALLQQSFHHFKERGRPEVRGELERFAEANAGWLHDYALFRALKDRMQWKSWEAWSAELKSRDTAALDAARRELAEPIAMYVYWQFLAHRQWAEVRAIAASRGVMLGGDLAFSPSRDSAEVWSNQHLFKLERSVGAPPDGFNPKGQRWGLPMPNWEQMRANGFAWWRSRVRDAAALYDLFRIDHVVGLYRTFSFGPNLDKPGEYWPAQEDAQREHGEAFIKTVLEEAGKTLIIAEDLGAVPAWVRASLTAFGIPGYKVMRWEKIKKNPNDAVELYVPPAKYPELALATTGTHDTETLVEWWRELPEADRRSFVEVMGLADRLDPKRPSLSGSELEAILEKLYASPARLVINPIQDLFGWDTRINLPGTVGDSNWAYLLPDTLENLSRDPAIRARQAKLSEIVARSGR